MPANPDSRAGTIAPTPGHTGGPPDSAGGSGSVERGTPEFRRAAVALFAAGFATFALLYCVQPLMPVFAREFGLSAATSSLVLSVSTATLAAGLLVTGPISDAVGRKPVMVAALLAASLFTLASVAMTTWHGILAMRALLGLSLCWLAAVAMTYLSEEIHPRVLGYAMGLYVGGTAIGGMGGRLIAGVAVDFVSWRTALGALGGLSLVATLVLWRTAPASRHFRRTPLRLRAVGHAFQLHLRDAALPWLFLEGFLLLGGFVTLFNYITYRLLAAPYHLSQATVGCLSVVYVAGVFTSARIGELADRLGRRRVFRVVIAVMLAGALVTLARPLWVILTGMVIFATGFFGAHSVASSWIGRRARVARAQASSLYLLCYYLGSSLAGTAGGYFWHVAGWTGVVGFIASLLTVALAVAGWLMRVPPLPEPSPRATTGA